jgi:hypothetical protein
MVELCKLLNSVHIQNTCFGNPVLGIQNSQNRFFVYELEYCTFIRK